MPRVFTVIHSGMLKSVYEKVLFSKCFSSRTKTQSRFQIYHCEERFRKVLFSVGRPYRKNNVGLSNFSCVVWTGPELQISYGIRAHDLYDFGANALPPSYKA